MTLEWDVPFEVPVDAVTQPWWDATRERRLVVQRCSTCQALQHHPRALCTTCGGLELSYEEVSGRGAVDVATEVHRPPAPGLEVPYVLARVRLAEGPVLLTRLLGTRPVTRTAGAPVVLDWAPLPDGRQLPVFRPDPERS